MAYHLTHPDSTQEIEVAADQLARYLGQGWQTKPQANPPSESKKQKPERGSE